MTTKLDIMYEQLKDVSEEVDTLHKKYNSAVELKSRLLKWIEEEKQNASNGSGHSEPSVSRSISS